MTRWTIESKGGIEYGVYEGATEAEAIAAMIADGGSSGDADPTADDLIVSEIKIKIEPKPNPLEIEIPITDEQIDELRTEAAEAGDVPMVAICDVALDEIRDEYPGAAEWQAQDMRRALSMDREAARLECARVIAEARAQEDE